MNRPLPRVLSAGDAPLVADATQLLVDVFRHDPSWRRRYWYLRANGVRRKLRRYYARAMARSLAHGRVEAVVENGGVVAVALWEAPGTPRPWARRVRARLGRGGARGGAAGRRWHLEGIAVRESARGRGLGGVLLAHGLRSVDRHGAEAELEATTPGSQRLYERHGFVATTRRVSATRPREMDMVRPARTEG
ncbi:Acetyltransferase (GNAT) domain-containing protein [Streptomyces zhaozhouensis]|uniref:Acetyltransferase (GNAT) domain-containing protein n=1 Tax=Streptomyces zhaozhouensis TaxID=1300267 RepID=A0A286E483_9ACTN|nr:GNAT family N-acetyltransferase [Streptomyces zhaozhouensis]SOD65689.1 Acetyltransferase (GNAT) domain-containing protein [Streptomyces zhaozhouensis]